MRTTVFFTNNHFISWPIVINDPDLKWEWVIEVLLRTKKKSAKQKGQFWECCKMPEACAQNGVLTFCPLILHQRYANLLLVLHSLTLCHSFWQWCGFNTVVIRVLIGWNSPPFRSCLRSLASNSLSSANLCTHIAAQQTVLSSWKPISQLGYCNNINHLIT